jgi:hypothetical protein
MAFEQRPDIETLALAIACSPIVVARALSRAPSHPAIRDTMRAQLPAGFDDADLAILRWIAEEARRTGRGLFRN